MATIRSHIGRVAVCLMLGACAQPARVAEMETGPIIDSAEAIEPDLRGSISLDSVSGGERTSPGGSSEIGNAEFQRALEQSLRANDLLAADQNAVKYDLSARIMNVSQPLVGGDFTVTSTVRYELRRQSAGSLVYENDVSAPYTAKFSDAFLGIERLQLANEGSARENIESFILELLASWNRLDRVSHRIDPTYGFAFLPLA